MEVLGRFSLEKRRHDNCLQVSEKLPCRRRGQNSSELFLKVEQVTIVLKLELKFCFSKDIMECENNLGRGVEGRWCLGNR